jgi:hypothetical protein
VKLGEVLRILKTIKSAPGYGGSWVSDLPVNPHSHRGYYYEVAFNFDEVTIDESIKHVECALIDTFTGYKGGNYQYHQGTPCHYTYDSSTSSSSDFENFEVSMHPLVEIVTEIKKASKKRKKVVDVPSNECNYDYCKELMKEVEEKKATIHDVDLKKIVHILKAAIEEADRTSLIASAKAKLTKEELIALGIDK